MIQLIQPEEFQAEVIKDIKAHDRLKKLTNMNEHSRWFMIVCAVSRVACDFINTKLLYVYDSIFPFSSDRYNLSRHAGTEGIELKDAEKAFTTVRIGSSALPTEELPIEQGHIVTTESGKAFELVETGKVTPETPVDTKGYYTTVLQVRALETGSSYNVPAESITKFETAPYGIDIVYNPEQVSGGSDDESNESVLERLSLAKQAVKRGSISWFKSETEKLETIQRAVVIPRYAGLGTVGIICIGFSGDVSDETLQEVESLFNLTDEDPAEAYRVVALRPEKFIQDFTITVWYDPDLDTPSDETLQDVLQAYIDELEIGETIIPRAIEARYMNAGMLDCAVTLPSEVISVAENNIVVCGSVSFVKEPFNA